MDADTHRGTRGQLDGRQRARRNRDAPRPHRSADFEHDAVTANEHHIDCEVHEERVDAAAGCQHHRGAWLHPVATEKSALPASGIEGWFDGDRQRGAATWMPQEVRLVRRIEQRGEKVHRSRKTLRMLDQSSVQSGVDGDATGTVHAGFMTSAPRSLSRRAMTTHWDAVLPSRRCSS